MQTAQTQIKLNIPVPLKDLLKSKARRFGVPMSSYIRHLIIQDVEDIPVYQASARTEKQYKKALNDIKNGDVVQVNDVDKFFDEL